MTPIDNRPQFNIGSHRLTTVLSLILAVILSSCGDAGMDNSSTVQPQDAQDPQFTVRPSMSAAELSEASTVTVQSAIALAVEYTEADRDNIDSPAAATPDTVNSMTLVETSEENTETQHPVDGTTDVGSAEPVNTETPTESASPATTTDVELVDNTPARNTIDSSGSDKTETLFSSVTTPGFEGEVLDDAIRIVWPVDPTARGYNVYRQAGYITTVFAAEFVDTDVYDEDYYYEIEAFDYEDNFSYIATGLTVSARTLGKTDPDAPAPNQNLLDEYALVFSDEFNGNSLDTSKWNTSFLWGADLFINGEEQYYVDIARDPDFGFNPFTFDGNNLTINTVKTPSELASKARNQPYLSGLITSYDSFKFTYGYAETRAKFTHGRGYWPAFWLLNAYYVDAKPEIDIMEFIGHNQDVMYHTYHYFDADDKLRSTESFPVTGIDFTADFHTFGVEWKPGTLIFYVDGIETHRVVDANVSQQEMYILANQAVGGWWAGSPDESTPFPGKYMVDYIRVYQRTTPYEEIQFDQSTDLIPLFDDSPGKVLPNHRPPFWLWPEGYPGAQ